MSIIRRIRIRKNIKAAENRRFYIGKTIYMEITPSTFSTELIRITIRHTGAR